MSKLFVLFTMQIQALRQDKGATAVEYALLIGFIVIILGTVTTVFGADLKARFDTIL